MRREIGIVVVGVLALLPPGLPGEEVPAAGVASVPLKELLELHRARDQVRTTKKSSPPVPATVRSALLQARVLEDALDLEGRFELSVLPTDDWVTVPLVAVDDLTTFTNLPSVGGGLLTAVDGHLSLVTRRPGDYVLELSWLQGAEEVGRHRRLEVDVADALVSRLLLQVDESLFRVESPQAGVQGSEGMLLYREGGLFTVEWERIATARVTPSHAARPPVEPVVEVARASAVSTLEGHATVQVLYELRLEGEEELVVELPPTLVLERVFLNGRATSFEVADGRVRIGVETGRAGDQRGRLELLLRSGKLGYLLAGTLQLTLPAVSWPVNEMFVELHLPEVFNYDWAGGSLSPHERPGPIELTYEMPRPGKHLSFHQYLISRSAPTVRVGYAIDLEGRYFAPGQPASP